MDVVEEKEVAGTEYREYSPSYALLRAKSEVAPTGNGIVRVNSVTLKSTRRSNKAPYLVLKQLRDIQRLR